MLYPQKIFENKIDEETHKQFVRFSLGNFESRAVIKLVKSKDSFKLNCSYDLVKGIIEIIAKNRDTITIFGKVIYKGKKKEEFEEKEISREELLALCEKSEFVLLNLKFQDYFLTVKKNLPKPGKPLKNNFCKAYLPLELLDKIEPVEFKKRLERNHEFVIKEIEVPKEYENDAALARLHAKRKGILIENLIVDRVEEKKEINFIA